MGNPLFGELCLCSIQDCVHATAERIAINQCFRTGELSFAATTKSVKVKVCGPVKILVNCCCFCDSDLSGVDNAPLEDALIQNVQQFNIIAAFQDNQLICNNGTVYL